MNKLVIRWQIGPFTGASLRALDISIRLMQRLEPEAGLHVTHQGPLNQKPGVHYHEQEHMYSHGRFYPPRFDQQAHEIWMENDHILWTLPPAWERFKARRDAVLAWIVDWDYYGSYAERVQDFRACPGMWGLPPGLVMPPPPAEENGNDQEEQGYVAWWLRTHPPHEIVTHDEVSAYMPNHDILKHTHSRLGTHGVHLPGLNRGWSAGGEKMLDEIERRYL